MKQPMAPRWAARLLDAVLGPEWGSDLRVELEPEYARRSREFGATRAVIWYVLQAVSPGTWRLRRSLRARRHGTVTRRVGRVMSWRHVRHSARELLRRPWLAGAVIVALALGIGANTAVFSVVEAVILRPLPYPDADRLVSVWGVVGGDGRSYLSGPEFDALEHGVDIFDELIQVKGYVNASLEADGPPERFQMLSVSRNYFDLYGVAASVGRTFREEDDILLPPSTVSDPDVIWPILKMVISHDLWVSRFGSDAAVIGKVVVVNGRKREIIGVTPEGFRGLGPAEWGETGRYSAWYLSPYDPRQFPRGTRFVRTLGKLRPGVTIEDAAAVLDRFAASERESHPIEARDDWRLGVAPLYQRVSEDARQPLFMLLGAVGFLLLIASANVATLLLARSAERIDDLRLRRALGASRRHLIALSLTESLLLAGAGTALGVILAEWGTRVLMALRPAEMLRADEVGLNASVLMFTIGLGLVVALLGGGLPAVWGTRRASDEGRLVPARGTSGAGFKRLGSILVSAEIALALVLAVGTGLLVQSFATLTSTDPGFTTDGIRIARVTLTNTSHPDALGRAEFYRRVIDVLRARPDVDEAGAIAEVPLDSGHDPPVLITDGRAVPLRMVPAAHRLVPGALETLGIPLLAGRLPDWSDLSDPDRLVAVVNQRFAEAGWPDGDAVGRSFQVTRRDYRDNVVVDVPAEVEIIGIVPSVRNRSLRVPGRPTIWVTMYLNTAGSYAIMARGRESTPSVESVKAAIHQVDPRLVVFDVSTMSDIVREELAELQFALTLLSAFGVLGLVLAALGVYGLLAYTVAQRQKELDIRAALGASPGRLIRLVLIHALSVVGVGVAVGWMGAWGTTRFLGSLLYGVSSTDLETLVGVAVLLVSVAVLASLIPGRRAGLADPAQAVRSE